MCPYLRTFLDGLAGESLTGLQGDPGRVAWGIPGVPLREHHWARLCEFFLARPIVPCRERTKLERQIGKLVEHMWRQEELGKQQLIG